MLRSVSHLPAIKDSFDTALADYRAARFRSCLRRLGKPESNAESLLRSRALLRLKEPTSSLECLQGLEGVTDVERAEVALLKAVTLSRLGVDASPMLLEATAYAISSSNTAVEADTQYYVALIAFGENFITDARLACDRVLDVVRVSAVGASSSYIIPLEHVISRTHELLGLLDATDGRYDKQLTQTKAALSFLSTCSIPDVYQKSIALKNLTILSRDFDRGEDISDLARYAKELPWSEDISAVQFRTLEALGWCYALRGDAVESLRLFRKAAVVASSVPEIVLLGLDRALIARSFGHEPMVCEELEHAAKIAFDFDWNTADGDLRVALLYLAQVAASVSPSVARVALDEYRRINVVMDPSFSSRLEDAYRAEEAYTCGVVMRAEGRLAASIERLTFAFSTWERIGFQWRAARAAVELAELEAGEPFVEAVRRDLITRPDSIFAARAYKIAV